MNISKVSKITGISARMIRFYEAEGVVVSSRRDASGYRDFDPENIANLRFIRNARELGFELREIRQLLEMWRKGPGKGGEIIAVVEPRLAKLRSSELRIKASRVLLESLLGCGKAGPSSECEFLEYLAAQAGTQHEHAPECAEAGEAS